MTEGGTAAQVPQEIARLARSHEEVSILFMDIVGEAGSVFVPNGMKFALGDSSAAQVDAVLLRRTITCR